MCVWTLTINHLGYYLRNILNLKLSIEISLWEFNPLNESYKFKWMVCFFLMCVVNGKQPFCFPRRTHSGATLGLGQCLQRLALIRPRRQCFPWLTRQWPPSRETAARVSTCKPSLSSAGAPSYFAFSSRTAAADVFRSLPQVARLVGAALSTLHLPTTNYHWETVLLHKSTCLHEYYYPPSEIDG